MNVETWDPHAASEGELRALYEFGLEFDRELDPETPNEPFEMWRTQVLQTSPFHENKRWVVRDGGRTIALAKLGLSRTEDNRHLAGFDISITRDRRRQGIATELLRHIAEVAEADGRSTLGGGAPKGSGGEDFLVAVGLDPKYLARRSRLRVNEVDRSLVERWISDAETKARDYSLLLFERPVADEHLDALIDLEETMNDEPREALDVEDWHLTPDQFRDSERRSLERGDIWLQLVARHEPTGLFTGFTALEWNPLLPQLVWQGGTAVRAEHRGHALGRWLKASMLNHLLDRNPKAEFIDTWNAGSNKWMLAINDDLGFKPYIWYPECQGRIEEIKRVIDK